MNALREVRASLFGSTTAPTRMTAGEFNGLKWAPKASFTPLLGIGEFALDPTEFPLHDGHEFARPSARRGRTMTGWPRLMRVLGLSVVTATSSVALAATFRVAGRIASDIPDQCCETS